MKTTRISLSIVLFLSCFSFLVGCDKDDNNEQKDGIMYPGIWIIKKGGIAISDTLHAFYKEYDLEIPSEGGDYRLESLADPFEGYHIEHPLDDNNKSIIIKADNRFNKPLYYEMTFRPNLDDKGRMFEVNFFSSVKRRQITIYAYQPPI